MGFRVHSQRLYGSDNGLTSYISAIFTQTNPIWTTNDVSWGGLSIKGAYDANNIPMAYPGTYCFSHVTARTQPCSGNSALQCGGGTNMEIWATANLLPGVLTASVADYIGSISTSPYKCDPVVTCNASVAWCQAGAPPTPTPFCYDSSWQQNDGLVSVKFAAAPIIGVPPDKYKAPVWRYSATNAWSKGTWYFANCECFAFASREED